MPADSMVIILMYFVLPVWLVAGFADWLCHRATHIESTTGAKESLIHLLMFGEVGIPLLAAMFLEINALIIGVMI
ncbi:MAG: diguanylate cyclase, partial [Hyphomicrobiales bacterium]